MVKRKHHLINCSHNWRVERPTLPTSMGVCSSCGDRAVFRNSVLDADLTSQINPIFQIDQGM